VPGFIAPGLVTALRELALGLDAAGDFRPAAVGSGPRRAVRPEIRGDRILWLHDAPAPVEREVLARFERLRLELNQELTLGLFEFECHFALYPPGAGYARHLDQAAGDARRTVSAVLYLNPDWQPSQGGELRLYLDDGNTIDIAPEAGTLAVFLSERFWHEVLPATRERLSLTGWFRRR
jgi:SM-20-related protein